MIEVLALAFVAAVALLVYSWKRAFDRERLMVLVAISVRGEWLDEVAGDRGLARGPSRLGGSYRNPDGEEVHYTETDAELRTRLICSIMGVEPPAPYAHKGNR